MTVQLPPKTAGEHRWIALATFTLTSGQASAAAGGATVKLGPHNLVTQDIGCVDCEAPWPAPRHCSAAAAPEMGDVTGVGGPPDLEGEGKERLVAAIDVVGRSGGKGFEVGFLDEDVPAHLARWYAHAQYKGARISTEEHPGPVEAAEALAWRLLEGGQCTSCRRLIGLEGHAGGGPCRWRRVGDCWVPGCLDDTEVAGYVAARRANRERGAKG